MRKSETTEKRIDGEYFSIVCTYGTVENEDGSGGGTPAEYKIISRIPHLRQEGFSPDRFIDEKLNENHLDELRRLIDEIRK